MTRVGVLAIVLLFSGLAAVNAWDNNNNAAESTSNATSCAEVTNDLGPCLGFIKGKVNKPPAACCDGARQLKKAAKTKADRQAICECIKKAVSGIGKFDSNRIPQLVKDCNIDIKLPPISRNTDCSKVSW
ncbi:non-specific lipid-transfer protein A-like [Corylus avellana]|uniref:non-specific lipid-transfer protein A-like n=1 Tax=Corylus avellana TaxID=13451 RepID=UPI00286CF5ED|nr:non-specific lipid-transfer protein A-like [Corylus avellana]